MEAQSGQSIKIEGLEREKNQKRKKPAYRTIFEATVPKDEVWIFEGVKRDSEGNYTPIIKKIKLQKPPEA